MDRNFIGNSTLFNNTAILLFLGDALFRLIDHFDNEFLTFSDFVNITCTICVLDKYEVLQYCFNMIDLKYSGVVNIEALKFFIKSLWGDRAMNNLKLGFDYIDRASRSNRGFVDLNYVKDLNQRYPQVILT